MFKNNLRSWYIYIVWLYVCMNVCMDWSMDAWMYACACMQQQCTYPKKVASTSNINAYYQTIETYLGLQQVFQWGRKNRNWHFVRNVFHMFCLLEFLHKRFWKTPPAGIVRDQAGCWGPCFKNPLFAGISWDLPKISPQRYSQVIKGLGY